LDILSNLPDDVENRMEANVNFHSYIPSSPLLAEVEETLQQPIFSLKLPIRHDSSIDNDTAIFTMCEREKLNIFQVGLSEINVVNSSLEHFSTHQSGTSQVSISQVRSGQIDRFQSGTFENSTFEVGFAQVSPVQSSTPESSSTQISFTQIGFTQVSSGQIGSGQIGLTQIDSRKLNHLQLNFSQVNPTEIPLTSSITLQQLLSSHHPNLQNTTVPTWTSFLQSPTQFNLKLEISDLPTGQLASATISDEDVTVAILIPIEDADVSGLGVDFASLIGLDITQCVEDKDVEILIVVSDGDN